jgi:NADPH:quinone reductase-like Zn-dependent oxidoreductase
MRAIRIHGFGGIDTIRLDEIPRPVPGAGEVLVAVKPAGVGPWDRLVREGKSTAHRMLDGAPHKPGKIVLKVAD